jgi:hypothetical protein
VLRDFGRPTEVSEASNSDYQYYSRTTRQILNEGDIGL